MTELEVPNSEETAKLLDTASTCSHVSSVNGGNTPSVCGLDANPYRPDARLPGPVPGAWDETGETGASETLSNLSTPGGTGPDSAAAAPSSSMPLLERLVTNITGLSSSARSWLPGWPMFKANSSSLFEQTRDELAKCRGENDTMRSELDDKERTIRELLDAKAKRLQESAITTWIKDTVITTIARILGMVDRVVIQPPQALHERMADQDWYKNTKSRVSDFSVWPLFTAVGSTAVSGLPSMVGSAASSVGAAASSAVTGLTEQATESYNAAWRWGSSYFGGDSEADGGSANKSEVTVPTGAHTKPPIVI